MRHIFMALQWKAEAWVKHYTAWWGLGVIAAWVLWENPSSIYQKTWHFPETRHPNLSTTTSCTGERGHIYPSTWHYLRTCSCDKLCDGLHTPFPRIAQQTIRKLAKSIQEVCWIRLIKWFKHITGKILLHWGRGYFTADVLEDTVTGQRKRHLSTASLLHETVH